MGRTWSQMQDAVDEAVARAEKAEVALARVTAERNEARDRAMAQKCQLEDRWHVRDELRDLLGVPHTTGADDAEIRLAVERVKCLKAEVERWRLEADNGLQREAALQAEIAGLRAVVDEIHEAVGESPASDDATLPGFVRHIREDARRKALEEAADLVRTKQQPAASGLAYEPWLAHELIALAKQEVGRG